MHLPDHDFSAITKTKSPEEFEEDSAVWKTMVSDRKHHETRKKTHAIQKYLSKMTLHDFMYQPTNRSASNYSVRSQENERIESDQEPIKTGVQGGSVDGFRAISPIVKSNAKTVQQCNEHEILFEPHPKIDFFTIWKKNLTGL